MSMAKRMLELEDWFEDDEDDYLQLLNEKALAELNGDDDENSDD